MDECVYIYVCLCVCLCLCVCVCVDDDVHVGVGKKESVQNGNEGGLYTKKMALSEYMSHDE